MIFPTGNIQTNEEKIQQLEEKRERYQNDATFEEKIEIFVLLQFYNQIEYGEITLKNLESIFQLAQFYFENKYFVQAEIHLNNGKNILKILRKTNDSYENILFSLKLFKFSVHVAFILISQRKTNDFTNIDKDFQQIDEDLAKVQNFITENEFQDEQMEYFQMKLDRFVLVAKEFNSDWWKIFEDLRDYFNEPRCEEKFEEKFQFLIRSANFWHRFSETKTEAIRMFEEAFELAENRFKNEKSKENRHRLAKVQLFWARRLIEEKNFDYNTKEKLLEAQRLFQENERNEKNSLEVIEDLTNFYTKTEDFDEAIALLLSSMPDVEREFGEFSPEMIEKKFQLGAIFLRQSRNVEAVTYLKQCLELQEFIYGRLDKRTCQTQELLEILKKDKEILAKCFTQELENSKKHFHVKKNISYQQKDNEFLFNANKSHSAKK